MTTLAKLLNSKKISDIINARMIQAPASTSIKDAVDLMRREASAYIVVTEGTRVVGMLTETDVCQRILGKPTDGSAPIREFMTPNPSVLHPDETVGKAIDLMAENRFYHIPLVDGNQNVSGVLSVRTLIRWLAEFYPAEVYNLPPNPHQVPKTAEGG